MTQVINKVKYNLAVPKAKPFKYDGHTFAPFHIFKGGAARYDVISKRLTGRVLEDDWDYHKFYEKCKEQNGDLKVDVFVMQTNHNPILVIPAKNCLFGYAVE